MKNIQVTDETYEFLMNLSKEIKEQDNRDTASPCFFQVQETIKIPAHSGSGEEVWYSSEYETEIRTDEEKIKWIKDNPECFENTEYKDVAETIDNETDILWVNDALETAGFQVYNEDTMYVYGNAFLTSKACDEHIRANKHNLKNPVNYLSHAYRNEELARLLKFITGLTE
jgi:hypothetical protein